MQFLTVFFLFIIASAVAPHAIENIMNAIGWFFKVVLGIIGCVAAVLFFGMCFATFWHHL